MRPFGGSKHKRRAFSLRLSVMGSCCIELCGLSIKGTMWLCSCWSWGTHTHGLHRLWSTSMLQGMQMQKLRCPRWERFLDRQCCSNLLRGPRWGYWATDKTHSSYWLCNSGMCKWFLWGWFHQQWRLSLSACQGCMHSAGIITHPLISKLFSTFICPSNIHVH